MKDEPAETKYMYVIPGRAVTPLSQSKASHCLRKLNNSSMCYLGAPRQDRSIYIHLPIVQGKGLPNSDIYDFNFE